MILDPNRSHADAQQIFSEFIKTIQALRDPVSGCPWDLKQTFLSLRPFMIEEAYEAAAAMKDGPLEDIVDELGDVLLQVVLNAQLGTDEGKFSLYDVINAINTKMIRRHPHVFAAPNAAIESPEDVKRQWAVIKQQEKDLKGQKEASLFASLGGDNFPATTHALKIGKRAAKVDFDFQNSAEVFAQLRSEIAELAVELSDPKPDEARIADELGDLYFTLAQVCRHLGQDPETVAAAGNQKFLRRFQTMEAIAQEKGQDLRAANRGAKEALWQAAKTRTKATTL